MARIEPLTVDNASTESANILTAIKNKIGMVPNLYAAFAHSPAALNAYLAYGEALNDAALSPKLREQLALVTAGTNTCDYCASAHTLLGKGAGVEESELPINLQGKSNDPKTQAALSFAKSIVTKQGRVDDGDLAAVRSAGYSEQEIVEIVAVVAINIFTNYFNHIAEVEIDFPKVSTQELANA